MHPEIRQIGPGHCPKCGMALEPLMPTETVDDSEIRSVRRRFWIALALAIPVVLIAMVPHVLGSVHEPSTAWTLRMLELTLSAPVVLWAAVPYYRRGWLGVVHRSPNMYTLIGLGVIVAFSYSVIATFFPGQFPPTMRDEHAWSAFISKWLRPSSRSCSSENGSSSRPAAVQALRYGNSEPGARTARRITNGEEEDVPLESLRVGDKVRVRPGEKIPVDGRVVSGQSEC